MKILIDLCHPAHVHFFKHAIQELQKKHTLILTLREKEFTKILLDELNLQAHSLGKPYSASMRGKLCEMLVRDFKLTRIIQREKPDVLSAIGGTFVAHAGFVTKTKSIIFYDTAHATLANAITYPFATNICVPECYSGPVPSQKEIRYNGYHELAYLHPRYFVPEHPIALLNGLHPKKPTIVIRTVAFNATHDRGQHGISQAVLQNIIEHFSADYHFLISAEGPLSSMLEPFRYQGNPLHMHHVLAFSALYVGESPTMASEAAVLGVHGIYINTQVLDYVSDIEKKYDLITQFRSIDANTLIATMKKRLQHSTTSIQNKRLIEDHVDVTEWIVQQLENAC